MSIRYVLAPFSDVEILMYDDFSIATKSVIVFSGKLY
jgi:hypothetical protein